MTTKLPAQWPNQAHTMSICISSAHDGGHWYSPNAVQALIDAAVAAERERLRVLVEAVRDANRDAEDADTFRLLKPGQERAWARLLSALR